MTGRQDGPRFAVGDHVEQAGFVVRVLDTRDDKHSHYFKTTGSATRGNTDWRLDSMFEKYDISPSCSVCSEDHFPVGPADVEHETVDHVEHVLAAAAAEIPGLDEKQLADVLSELSSKFGKEHGVRFT